jgi:hypothetical protein
MNGGKLVDANPSSLLLYIYPSVLPHKPQGSVFSFRFSNQCKLPR